jgi:hypothetical protein
VRYLFRYPASHIFGRRIKGNNVVDMLMVEPIVNLVFDFLKIAYHTRFIQFLRLAIDSDYPVMAVDAPTGAHIGQVKLMAARNF